jgi:hypothetical protein
MKSSVLLIFLFIWGSTIVFEALVTGGNALSTALPPLSDVNPGGCTFSPGSIPVISAVGAATGYIGCVLANFFNLIINGFKLMIGAARVIWTYGTFQGIPNTPIFVTVALNLLFSVPFLLAGLDLVVKAIRGASGE